jgi:invasion protein IalB
MKRVLELCSVVATYLVLGGTAVEAANDPRAAQLTYESWFKVCIDNSYCTVGAGARGTCYPSGGVLSIAMPDGKSANLYANLGARALEGGISVQIDQGDPILIPHLECYASGCGGKVEIDSAFIERLKRSQMVTIEATTAAHQKISLSLSLAGFAKAYDGPRTEPKMREEILTDEKWKELMQREEEEKPRQKALQCKE